MRGTTVGCGTLSECENQYKGVTLIGFNLTIDDKIDRKLYSMCSTLVSALNQETTTIIRTTIKKKIITNN